MEKSKLASNIWKLSVIKAVRSGMFSIAIITPFFIENGVSVKEVIYLQALFSLAAIIFEFPTGYFADNYGRKNSIILGGFFSSLGFFLYSLSHGFWEFLLAETVLALGMSFVSGADGALLIETQGDARDTGLNISQEGEVRKFGFISEGLTSLIGGSLVAVCALRVPLYLDALFSSLVFFIGFSLVESKRKIQRKNIFEASKKVGRFLLVENRGAGKLICFSAICSASTLNMVWFIQPYWIALDVPVKFFGYLWASFFFFGAFVSASAYKLEKSLKKKSLLIILIASVVGYFPLSMDLSISWCMLAIMPFYIARGLSDPVTRGYLNGEMTDEQRSSILSVRNLVYRLVFAFVGPMMGWVGEAYSLQTALLVSGVTFGLMGLVAWMFLVKHKAA
ncbi:MAG: MFS transporter [Candidatus Moranbacteria bacterium]|jgi:MFS family permease|nr:MFS transporter [Candidatus Moranbacteria bacterium]